MKTVLKLTIILLALVSGCQKKQSANDSVSQKETIIAFGSCNRPELDQLIWQPIIDHDPEVFIWLGDIIYGDSHDTNVLRDMYNHQKSNPEYKELLQSTPVIGIWDDHDYGVNDGGKFFSEKEASKSELLDFLDVPDSAEVRSHEGAFSSYQIDNANSKIKVVLLDGRYFRDTLILSDQPGEKYIPNPDGDILGEEQWAWFENELKNSSADIHIIGCGIQILPTQHRYEKWANFPKSRKRLLDLLSEYNVSHPILISGDRHHAEISTLELDKISVFELTSSGLTHAGSIENEPNDLRIGPFIAARNFGLIKIKMDEYIQLEVRGLNDTLYNSHKILL